MIYIFMAFKISGVCLQLLVFYSVSKGLRYKG